MDKALAEGLVKMKAARAIKTAQKEEHRCWNDIIGRSDGGIGYQLLDMQCVHKIKTCNTEFHNFQIQINYKTVENTNCHSKMHSFDIS